MEQKKLEEKTDKNISKILNPENKYKRIEQEIIDDLTKDDEYGDSCSPKWERQLREKQKEEERETKYSKIMKRTSEYLLEFGC